MRGVVGDDEPAPVPRLSQRALDPAAVLPVKRLGGGRPEGRGSPPGVARLDQPMISHPCLAISRNRTRHGKVARDPVVSPQRRPNDLDALEAKALPAVQHANT